MRTNSVPVFFVVLFLTAMIVIFSIEASISNHQITPSNATTEDNLICSWTPSSDTTQQNVTWYNGSVQYSNVSNIPFSENQTQLAADIAKEDETWTCSVRLKNATGTYEYNTSITIDNAYPSPPNATNETLYEDQTVTIPISATDPDDDVLSYYQLNSSFYCSIAETTGISTCTPNASHAGNTNVTYYVRDEEPTLVGTDVTYTVILVNDPPVFNLSDQNATEGTAFNYSFTASDEEENYPLSFALQSNLSTLIITNISNVSSYITFDRASHAPIFGETGTWNVTVNVTDTGPYNSTPYDNNRSTQSFLLVVSAVNHAPNITTNLSGHQGTQGSLFTLYVNASDVESNDSLTFNVDSNCSLTNPWNITTINSSNNGTGRINQTLNNTHVVCRWINISVTDSKEYDWEMVFINITNTNDAPTLHEISDYSGNDGRNMSNLSAVKGREFNYHVNVTDPDELTYEGEAFTYVDNTSLFEINSTSGQITFTPDISDVGLHHILINISDDGGLSDSRVMTLEVVNNTAPTLDPIGSFSCAEDSYCVKIITASDPDTGENLTFNDNSSLFTITYVNETAGKINFTPTNSNVGTFLINVSVADYYSFMDYEVFNLTINNTNDAPFFDQDNDGVEDNVSFGTVVENITKTVRINATDEDLDIGLDNLTFSWVYVNETGNMTANTNTTTTGSDYFIITLTQNTSNIGNQTINISVTDNSSVVSYQLVTFTVLAQTLDPSINQIKPYRNSTDEATIDAFANASWFSSNNVTANVSENVSIVFDAIATNDSSISNNQLVYYWYSDGVLNSTLDNVVPGSNSSLTMRYSFFDSGNHSIGLIVEDTRYSTDMWNWTVTVEDVNRAPTLVNALENLTVNTSITIQDYFSYRNAKQYFYDPDDDLNSDGLRGSVWGEDNTSLTYQILSGGSCSYASFSISGDDLSITPSEIGTCFLTFNATDTGGEYVDSGTVRVTISDVVQEEVQVPQSSSGGSSQSRPKIIPIPVEEPEEIPVPLEIVVPEQVTTYANKTIMVPVTLENKWNGSIEDIRINATAIGYENDSINATVKISKDYFSILQKDENVSLSIVVEDYREDEPYEIHITADVGDPEYTDTASVLINSMEKTEDDDNSMENKIEFARDLLNDNPECQELVELVDKADQERIRKNYAEASKLLTASIEGCKYLINEQVDVQEERPKRFYGILNMMKRNLSEVIIGGIIVGILIALMVTLIISARKTGEKI